mmetsp:Transcript_18777/g.21601  ORF Transcript_18777/g.21601 Transcript_18777/m.21601 type:complete len:92 (-) Transcript_18777:812-1087(-)
MSGILLGNFPYQKIVRRVLKKLFNVHSLNHIGGQEDTVFITSFSEFVLMKSFGGGSMGTTDGLVAEEHHFDDKARRRRKISTRPGMPHAII